MAPDSKSNNRDFCLTDAGERSLIESEKKYRELVELAHEGIITSDVNDNFTFVNSQFARGLGYKVEELLGTSIFDYTTKLSSRIIRTQTEERKRGKQARYEITLFHKNGSKKYFWLSASPRFDENGKFIGSMGVFSDITEKKLTEMRLKKRIRHIDTLYKTYSYARIRNSLSTFINGILEELVKAFPYSEFVQGRIQFDGVTYTYPKHNSRFIRKIEIPLVISDVKRGFIQIGYTKKVQDLDEFHSLNNERELMKNIVDIIKRHIVAREINNNYKDIVTRAFTAILIVRNNEIRYANPRFYSLFKCKKSDASNVSFSNYFSNCNLKELLRGGHIKECVGRRADGRKLDMNVRVMQTQYNGKPAYLVRANDISALKHAQDKLKNFNEELRSQVKEKTQHLEDANKRLQNLNEMKDEFIAIMSHELRSPLTSVRGYLSLLVEDDVIEQIQHPYRDFLLRAYSTSDSLNYLINNILDASRLDMGRFNLQVQDIDIIKLTKNIVDSLSFQARERYLRMEFNNSTGVSELLVPVDSIRISQVLRNVLDNSIKFTKRGKQIFIKIVQLKKSVKIIVTDQGVGIPKAKLEEVFDKFMQVKNINTKYKGGVGLGLFITKRIVQLHGGKISADQNEFGGTSISITLPLTSKINGKTH